MSKQKQPLEGRARDPRNRKTERITAGLLKLEAKRAAGPLTIIAIGLLVTALCGLYIVKHINGGVGATHKMQFDVGDATGVVPSRAEVRFYGIEAGKVAEVKLEKGHAIITANVGKDFGPIYKDARAAVRPNTALQDMYIDILDRGTPQAGEADENFVVPLSQTTSPVNIAEVLNTFQPPVRTQLYTLLDQFGNGLDDRGADLRRGFAQLAPLLKIAGQTADQLAVREDLTKELVHNASVLSSTLAERSGSLHELVTSGTRTLEAASTQNGIPLHDTVHELSEALDTAHDIIFSLLEIEPKLDVIVNRLPTTVDLLPSALDDLQRLTETAGPAVQRLRPPVRSLIPLTEQLQPFSSNLETSLKRIRPQISDVDTVTTDLAACTDEINEFFNWDLSMSKFKDDLGPFVRGNVNFGFYSVPGVEDTTYDYREPCAGGAPIGGVPVPKYNGPPPVSP